VDVADARSHDRPDGALLPFTLALSLSFMGLSISRSVNLGPLSISVTIGGPEEAPSPSRTKRYERPPGTLMPDGRRLPDMRVWDEPKPDEGSPFRGKNSSPGGATKGATIEDEAAELYEEQVDGVRRDLMKELDAASDEELEHLMSIFQSLDSDGDLYVDVGELGFGMERLHRAISDREVRRLFGEADTDGDGYIDFEEFAAVAVRHRKAKEAAEDEKELLGDVFKVFDAEYAASAPHPHA
jgi:hypothetical protein